jgi:phosphosulfolactate synthase
MVIDTGLGLLHTKDQLQICSEYIDLWKLGWATSQLQPPEVIESKISILREHEISVCNGGTLLELAEFQGISSKLFSVLADVGADATEISSGSLEISSDRVCELISEAKSYRLRPYCEVGKKIPENDYEVSEYNERIKLFLEAGAEKVIIEARESGVGVGVMDSEGNVNEDDLSAIIDGIDIDSVIFEAPKKNQQVFFLKRFGPEANLGNIAPSDVISLETLRRGLRGDTIEDFYFVVGERHLHKHGWRD